MNIHTWMAIALILCSPLLVIQMLYISYLWISAKRDEDYINELEQELQYHRHCCAPVKHIPQELEEIMHYDATTGSYVIADDAPKPHRRL